MKFHFCCVLFILELLTLSLAEIDDYEKIHNFIMRKMDSEDSSLRAGIGQVLDVTIQIVVVDMTNLNQVFV